MASIAGSTAVVAALASLGDLAAAPPSLVALSLLGLLPLALLGTSQRPTSARSVLVALVLSGVALRVVLLVATPATLSDDLFRYVWEGRLATLGVDPFDVAPDSPRLAAIAAHAPEWPRVNHPELPAIYPAGAQWIFASLASLSPSPWLFRAAMVAADGLLLCALAALLWQQGRDPRWLALYALHPLPIVEVGSSGHYEPLALLPLVLGLLVASRPRGERVAFALFGLAASIKYLPGVAAVLLARTLWRGGRRRTAVIGLAVAALVFFGLAAPFALDGRPPLGSLGTYIDHWGHNGSVHALLTPWLGYHPARKVVGLCFFVGAGVIVGGARTIIGPLRDLFFLLLVLSPVVHPWYGLWLLVLLPLAPTSYGIALTGLLPLAVLLPAGGAAAAESWRSALPWLEYGLPAALLLIHGVRARRARGT